MFYLKVRLVFIIFLASLFFCADSLSVKSLAEEQAATEGADSAPERKIPSLAPGQWEPLFELEESIYPSVVISTATLKEGLWKDKQHIGDPWGMIGIVARGDKNNCPISVEISGENFVQPSIFTGTLEDKGTVYCVYPDLKYNYEKLLSVKQTIPEGLSFKVKVGDKNYPEKIIRVQVRPINECVFNFTDSSGVTNDISFFFAAYVNENHPEINQILKEAISSKRVDSFSGYFGDKESLMAEIQAVWDTLKARGLHYSTMPASADDDNPYLGSQYVRLLGESVNYTQANCVDGSVLMASVFRKIGLDVSLIELPDHMFISVSLGKEEDPIFIETTLLSQASLDEAMEAGIKQYLEHKDKFGSEKDEDQAYNIVNIQAARVIGIMPIKDSSVN